MTKKGKTGEYRHMGPEPNLLKAILDDFETRVPPEQMTETIITGRLMEVKGQMLQSGTSKTANIILTVEEYKKKIGEIDKSVRKKKDPKEPASPISEETMAMVKSELYRQMMDSVKDSPESAAILSKAASSLGMGSEMDWTKISEAEDVPSSGDEKRKKSPKRKEADSKLSGNP